MAAILSAILNFRWTTTFFKTVGYSEPPCQISCLYHQMHDFSLICLANGIEVITRTYRQFLLFFDNSCFFFLYNILFFNFYFYIYNFIFRGDKRKPLFLHSMPIIHTFTCSMFLSIRSQCLSSIHLHAQCFFQ